MARGGGSIVAGGIYHVIPRFVAKAWLMESAVERNMYLSLLGGAMLDSDWRCFAFALMSNHLHLGFLAGRDPLHTWLRPIHTKFANWLNQRRERIGAVFVKGPNVIEYQPEGTAHLISYIHRNPVRAGVVATPQESDWTSHRAYAGKGPRRPWLDVNLGLELAGFSNGADFAEWTESTVVAQPEVDAFRIPSGKRRGRPWPQGATGSLDELVADESRTAHCRETRSDSDFLSGFPGPLTGAPEGALVRSARGS